MQRNIWMYWENKPGQTKPAYLGLAFQTVLRHSGSYNVVLLDEHTICNHLEVPEYVHRLSEIAHKADYYRFKLLQEYGGVWLDSDIILLRKIEKAVDPFLEDHDFVGYGEEYGQLNIGFMACRPGCALVNQHVQHMENVLEQKSAATPGGEKIKLDWVEIGESILWRFAQDYAYHHHNHELIEPTSWDNWEFFENREISLDDYLSNDPYCVMLFNQMMFDSYKDVSKEQILDGETLLSRLFHKSLDIKTAHHVH